ncbi:MULTISPECIES: AMP-binding protein [unclassified Streptomyces]|uniref:AMP-binding protein n=1 Tax=unclassified Streptomyces TaxID=2593676 RepID=UPI00336A4D0D
MPRTSRTEELPTLAAAARQAPRVALRWISEPDCEEELTHAELLDQAGRAAAALTRLGVRAGDRVAVHLPLIPESVIATLACGRLDAVRSTLPVGLRVHELRARLAGMDAKVLITADGDWRRGEPQPLKPLIDRALAGSARTPKVLVVHRLARPVSWTPGRDLWWHEQLAGAPADAPSDRSYS